MKRLIAVAAAAVLFSCFGTVLAGDYPSVYDIRHEDGLEGARFVCAFSASRDTSIKVTMVEFREALHGCETVSLHWSALAGKTVVMTESWYMPVEENMRKYRLGEQIINTWRITQYSIGRVSDSGESASSEPSVFVVFAYDRQTDVFSTFIHFRTSNQHRDEYGREFDTWETRVLQGRDAAWQLSFLKNSPYATVHDNTVPTP